VSSKGALNMKKLALGLALVALAACEKDIEQTPAPVTVVARFNPGENPPVVPAPNDLAFNPETGKLDITTGQTPADLEFEGYLGQLNGFPADTPGSTTFSSKLAAGSVTNASVKVFSATNYDPASGTATLTEVTGATISYSDIPLGDATGGQITIVPPNGSWTPGGSYVVAVVGYGEGVTGAKGEQVVGDTAWTLIRSKNPLAVCDASGQNCTATTSLIPSDFKDPATRLADQGRTAGQLEQLRLKYAPYLNALDSAGIDRTQVALLWSFGIADNIVTPVFQLDANPCNVRIPLPNDLAVNPATGLLAAPTGCPGQVDADSEFTGDYVNHLNGFPTAVEGSVQFVGGTLDPATVVLGDNNVLFVDLTADEDATVTADAPSAIHYDSASNTLTFDPPADATSGQYGWQKGHRFAVALLPGVKGSNGEDLVASDVFALLRMQSSLVDADCDVTAADTSGCHSAITLAPLTDAQAVQLEQIRALILAPAFAELAEQHNVDATQVAALWTFKVFDNPELSFNLTLDNSKAIIPFPFNGRNVPGVGTAFQFYAPGEDGGAGHVTLPTNPFSAALNTLDGFSTTAPIVTAFGASNPRDLTDGANVDPASINPVTDPDAGTVAINVGLLNLSGTEAPLFNACVNCGKASLRALLADGGSVTDADVAEPEQLTIVPTAPLLEQTDYAGFVGIDVKDTEGRGVAPSSIFALLRMKTPIMAPDENGIAVPTIPAIRQALLAHQFDGLGRDLGGLTCNSIPNDCSLLTLFGILESARQQFQGLFDTLDDSGLPRGQVALAWDFHTQTTYSALPALYAAPQLFHAAGFPVTTPYVFDASTQYLGTLPSALKDHINKVFISQARTPFLLKQDDGTNGPFNPHILSGQTTPGAQKVPLVVFEPTGTAPTNGWPVAIFGHGITRFRNDALLLANAVNAAGYALVAFDEPFHGDRSSCAGAGAAVGSPSDDVVCAVTAGSTGDTASCDETPASPTYGRCLAGTRATACDPTGNGDLTCALAGLGDCADDGKCEGATFAADSSGRPLISGWNFIDLTALNTYFFLSTRDHFRQDVVDVGQLEQVIGQDEGTAGSLNARLVAAGGDKLDGSNVNYVGQSLGGILGTLVTSASPTIGHAVLNVPGGDLTQVILASPGLEDLRTPLLAALGAQGYAPGSPEFDQFFNFGTWVMDPADPVNAANHLLDVANPTPSNRAVLVQYIENDQTVPNFATDALVYSANRDPTAPQVTVHEFTPDASVWPVDSSRHGFLLNGLTSGDQDKAAITADAQTEAATWIATGAQPQP
jgi:hypothetical protein